MLRISSRDVAEGHSRIRCKTNLGKVCIKFFIFYSILKRWFKDKSSTFISPKFVQVGPNPTTSYFLSLLQVGANSKFEELEFNNSWLKDEKLVAKPDQLIKRYACGYEFCSQFLIDEEKQGC